MPRRKKLTPTQKAINWLEAHRKVMWLLVALLVILVYTGLHAYRGWADTQRMHAARQSVDSAYASISKRLGQPDNLARSSDCQPGSSLGQNYTLCNVETDFIYGAANETQANVFLKQIQKIIAGSRGFKARKLSSQLSDSLVQGNPNHQASDFLRGPYGAACYVRYVYDTPDQTTLSWNNASLQAFEVFFGCSHKSVKLVYPSNLLQ